MCSALTNSNNIFITAKILKINTIRLSAIGQLTYLSSHFPETLCVNTRLGRPPHQAKIAAIIRAPYRLLNALKTGVLTTGKASNHPAPGLKVRADHFSRMMPMFTAPLFPCLQLKILLPPCPDAHQARFGNVFHGSPRQGSAPHRITLHAAAIDEYSKQQICHIR